MKRVIVLFVVALMCSSFAFPFAKDCNPGRSGQESITDGGKVSVDWGTDYSDDGETILDSYIIINNGRSNWIRGVITFTENGEAASITYTMPPNTSGRVYKSVYKIDNVSADYEDMLEKS